MFMLHIFDVIKCTNDFIIPDRQNGDFLKCKFQEVQKQHEIFNYIPV